MLRLRLHQAAGRKTGPRRQIIFGRSQFTKERFVDRLAPSKRHGRCSSGCWPRLIPPISFVEDEDLEEKNGYPHVSTYHDASICSLKRRQKLVSFPLCQTGSIPWPRFCANASSFSTARWEPLCSSSV